MEVSKCLIPVTFKSAIVYSLGTLAFVHSISFGSNEVGFVVSPSCANELNTEATTIIIVTLNLDRSLCINFVLVFNTHFVGLKLFVFCDLYNSLRYGQAAN